MDLITDRSHIQGDLEQPNPNNTNMQNISGITANKFFPNTKLITF